MKTEKEITEMLHTEIDNQKRLNKLFSEAVERGDDIRDITKIFIDASGSTYRILALKDVLNQN